MEWESMIRPMREAFGPHALSRAGRHRKRQAADAAGKTLKKGTFQQTNPSLGGDETLKQRHNIGRQLQAAKPQPNLTASTSTQRHLIVTLNVEPYGYEYGHTKGFTFCGQGF